MVKRTQSSQKTDTSSKTGADSGWIGGRIKQLRTQEVISVLELAERSGAGRSTITKIESGATQPHPSTIRKISRVLKSSPQFLMTGQEAANLAVENLSPHHDRLGLPSKRAAIHAIDEVLALIRDQREELIARLGDGIDRDNVDALSVTYQIQRLLMEARRG